MQKQLPACHGRNYYQEYEELSGLDLQSTLHYLVLLLLCQSLCPWMPGIAHAHGVPAAAA
jgi:hypothetical protein